MKRGEKLPTREIKAIVKKFEQIYLDVIARSLALESARYYCRLLCIGGNLRLLKYDSSMNEKPEMTLPITDKPRRARSKPRKFDQVLRRSLYPVHPFISTRLFQISYHLSCHEYWIAEFHHITFPPCLILK